MLLKCHLSSVGSHKVRSFHFSILLCHSPTPNQSQGIIISFSFNFSNCSIFSLFSKLITLIFFKSFVLAIAVASDYIVNLL